MSKKRNDTTIALVSLLVLGGLMGAFLYAVQNQASGEASSAKVSRKVASHKPDRLVPAPDASVQEKPSQNGLVSLSPQSLAGLMPPPLHRNDDGTLVIVYKNRAWLNSLQSVPNENKIQSKGDEIAVLEELPKDVQVQIQALKERYQKLRQAEYQLHESYSHSGVDEELHLALQGKRGEDKAWQQVLDMVAARQQLRKDILGQKLAKGWFDEEEAMENYTLAVLGIARDERLNELKKNQQIAELELRLPSSFKEAFVGSNRKTALTSIVAQWQGDGLGGERNGSEGFLMAGEEGL